MDSGLYKGIHIVNTNSSFTGSIAKIEVMVNNFTGSDYQSSENLTKHTDLIATASITSITWANNDLNMSGFGHEPSGSLVGPIHLSVGKSLEGNIRRFRNLGNSVPVLVYLK